MRREFCTFLLSKKKFPNHLQLEQVTGEGLGIVVDVQDQEHSETSLGTPSWQGGLPRASGKNSCCQPDSLYATGITAMAGWACYSATGFTGKDIRDPSG